MQPEIQAPDQQTAGWQFSPNSQVSSPNSVSAPKSGTTNGIYVSWTASEFIAYQKSVGWYVLAFMALLGFTVATFFISGNDYISSGTIFLIGGLFLGFASRKPRVLNYEISNQGVRIGEKLFNFSLFRSFAVIEEESLRSIDILPLKRFMPAISMYYEPQDENAIINALGAYLPKEERKQPLIDKLMHKIRF